MATRRKPKVIVKTWRKRGGVTTGEFTIPTVSRKPKPRRRVVKARRSTYGPPPVKGSMKPKDRRYPEYSTKRDDSTRRMILNQLVYEAAKTQKKTHPIRSAYIQKKIKAWEFTPNQVYWRLGWNVVNRQLVQRRTASKNMKARSAYGQQTVYDIMDQDVRYLKLLFENNLGIKGVKVKRNSTLMTVELFNPCGRKSKKNDPGKFSFTVPKKHHDEVRELYKKLKDRIPAKKNKKEYFLRAVQEYYEQHKQIPNGGTLVDTPWVNGPPILVDAGWISQLNYIPPEGSVKNSDIEYYHLPEDGNTTLAVVPGTGEFLPVVKSNKDKKMVFEKGWLHH